VAFILFLWLGKSVSRAVSWDVAVLVHHVMCEISGSEGGEYEV
jgi:hypothetical protein